MRLKSVRIFGFKTFADRTEFNLDGGIVAVMGPNGCGKSNLVDAILWALGESNARHLRAHSSQDVIFSGSARRRPVGFAEVTLLFDNEDGALPIDTAEVAVTRRLTRGGDSSFYINRRSCRQRDVHELLADSGLGRAGYAIVGQKEIDQALAASPIDRRAWVDEAAGVQRYRVRKAESLKRLESARAHLVRVDDILRELESQREPLRVESDVARKYVGASEALREIETGILIKELKTASAEVDSLERQLESSAAVARSSAAEAERCEDESNALHRRITEVEHRIEGLRTAIQGAISAQDHADAAARLGEERLRSLAQLEATLNTSDGNDLIVQCEAELDHATKEEELEQLAIRQARSSVAGVGAGAAELARRLSAAEAELLAGRKLHSERMRRIAEQQHREERKLAIQRELAGLAKDLPSLAESCKEAQSECQLRDGEFAAAEAVIKQAEAQITALRAAEEEAAKALRVHLAEKAALEGRRRGIEATIESHEGLNQGSRALLSARDKGELTLDLTPLSAVISTTPEMSAAIEATLGAAADDLLVRDDQAAAEAVTWLRDRKLGRATVRPASIDRPTPEEQPSDADVLAPVSAVLKCEPEWRTAVESLFARAFVVTNLAAAVRLNRETGFGFATLAGEWVDSSGAITGGATAKAPHSMLRRRSELATLVAEMDALEHASSLAREALAHAERAIASVKQSREAAQAEATIKRTELREAERYLQTLSSEFEAAKRSENKLRHELEQLANDIELGCEVDVQSLEDARNSLIAEVASRSADANRARTWLAEAENRWQQAKSRTAAVARRLDHARHSEHQRTLKLQTLEPERQKIRLEIHRQTVEREQAAATRMATEGKLRDAQAEKDELLSRSVALAESARQIRARLSELGTKNHQAELARARAESKRAVASERLLDQYGVGVEEALLHENFELPKDAQSIVSRLRRELKALGVVNVGAIEAYERVTTRCEELEGQRKDIVEGIDQVRASIRELDSLTRDRFRDTFDKVEAAYRAMFQKLFGGGEGRIFLENPDSDLDSGIEIEVTLPGKKRQRLELLSGGERALCAAGFLFALLDVKPSPLVVLDEVDAPLDGRNVERFGDVLQEFTDRIQFMVITHNPTTIERAPIWLGVTMKEPGVSTLIPARVPAVAIVDSSRLQDATALALEPA